MHLINNVLFRKFYAWGMLRMDRVWASWFKGRLELEHLVLPVCRYFIT